MAVTDRSLEISPEQARKQILEARTEALKTLPDYGQDTELTRLVWIARPALLDGKIDRKRVESASFRLTGCCKILLDAIDRIDKTFPDRTFNFWMPPQTHSTEPVPADLDDDVATANLDTALQTGDFRHTNPDFVANTVYLTGRLIRRGQEHNLGRNEENTRAWAAANPMADSILTTPSSMLIAIR